MYRDDEFTAQSMLKEGMVHKIDKARQWVDEARHQQDDIKNWCAEMGGKDFFLPWRYEWTVDQDVGPFIIKLTELLDCDPWDHPEEIYDGNAQYREDT